LGIQVSGALQATPASGAKTGAVTFDAKPEPIAIDPARTSVIVVDMENDFAAKGGMFGLLAVYFAKRPPGPYRWYWFLAASLLGTLWFGLAFYWWLNARGSRSESTI
jgi:hypothetical protein